MKIKYIIFSLAFLSIVYISFCFVKSYEVYKVVREAFLFDEKYNDYFSKYMSQEYFEDFNRSWWVRKYPRHSKDVRIYYIPGFFNLNGNGKVWARYTYLMYDENKKVLTGAMNIPMDMIIIADKSGWNISEKNEYFH